MDEALSEPERAYHAQIVADMRSAQAAWQSWSRHLATRYQLSPEDSIAEDGAIVRAGREHPVT